MEEGEKGKSALAWLQSRNKLGGVPFWESLEGIERGEWYFPSAHFKAMLRYSLCAPLLDVTGRVISNCRCCEADKGVAVNIEGHYTHPMGCPSVSNYSLRHNDVRDYLESLLKRYSIRDGNGPMAVTTKEVTVHEGENGVGNVVMDIVYREQAHRQRVIYVDVAVVDPGAPTYVAGRSHEQPGAAAAAREADKMSSFRQRVPEFQDADSLFYAFVVESTGRLGERARSFLRDVVGARDIHVRA